MAIDLLPPCNNADEDDYIDMELISSSSSSSSNLLSFSTNSPPKTREFEFQMSSFSNEKQPTTSPADELFYKGKLLPLHLPPRLQMVQTLLNNNNSNNNSSSEPFEEFFSIPTTHSTNTSTPIGSCNISPSESCRVSSELNLDEYFFEWSTEVSGFIRDHSHTKKTWSKKLKQIKQSSLSQKLKASRAYLKSLFSKSACSNESCNVESESNFPKGYVKVSKRNPLTESDNAVKSIGKEMVEDNSTIAHRRSFTGVIKRHSATKCFSSSSSSGSSSSSSSSSSSGSSSLSLSPNSNGFLELQPLKRSCSASLELETSVEGAIAHCKKSQHPLMKTTTAPENALGGDKEGPKTLQQMILE